MGLREAPAQTHYVLRDLGEPAPATHAAGEHTLLIAWSSGSTFHDSLGLAYSRAPGARSYYRFASWSERPAARVAQLLQRRLAQSGAFRDVATTTDSVQGDWLLEVELEDLVHDDIAPPGFVRIVVFTRLVDRTKRRTIARRRFEQTEPLESESAAQAVQAFDRATTRLLDAAAGWVLEQARSPAAEPDTSRARRATAR